MPDGFLSFSQEKGGIFSGVFRKKVAKSQSQVRLTLIIKRISGETTKSKIRKNSAPLPQNEDTGNRQKEGADCHQLCTLKLLGCK